MALVVVYGIEVEEICADLLEFVIRYADTSSQHEREQADRALEKLGQRGCYEALKYIVKRYSGVSSSHCRQLATRAMELM